MTGAQIKRLIRDEIIFYEKRIQHHELHKVEMWREAARADSLRCTELKRILDKIEDPKTAVEYGDPT